MNAEGRATFDLNERVQGRETVRHFHTAQERDEYFVGKVQAEAGALASTLKEAIEAGTSHAIILPELLIVFRDAWGTMPPEIGEMIAQAAASA